MAGIKDNSDDLLLLMEQETQQLINTPQLHNLLTWVEKITDPTDGDIKYLGERAIAIANANANVNAIPKTYADAITKTYTNAYTYAITKTYADAIANTYVIANTYAIAEIIKDFLRYARWLRQRQICSQVDYDALISDLENFSSEIPDFKQSLKVRQKFSQKLIVTWLSYFHISQGKMILSKQELETFDRYLYSNLLIINTNEAASRVTQATWSGIESRMLLPVD